MNPPASLLDIATPSETALLDFARGRVSREMIHEIAMNDYGQDTEQHELAISKQLAPTPELGLLPWHPREVLELERWTEPDVDYGDRRPPTGALGHFKRLFACIILLRNVAFVSPDDLEGEGTFFIDISAATVIQLVCSSITLGSHAFRLALGFLLWVQCQPKPSSP